MKQAWSKKDPKYNLNRYRRDVTAKHPGAYPRADQCGNRNEKQRVISMTHDKKITVLKIACQLVRHQADLQN